MFTACLNPKVFMDFLYVYCSVVEENWQIKKNKFHKIHIFKSMYG